MGMAVHRHDASCRGAAVQRAQRRPGETGGAVHAYAGDSGDRLEVAHVSSPTLQQMLDEAQVQGKVCNTAETVAGFMQDLAEPAQVCSFGPNAPTLRETKRPAGRIVEGLIERRHKRNDRCTDALLQRLLAAP